MSDREVLRDGRGNRIGEIETVNGKQILPDRHRNRLGEFNPKSNLTRDHNGNRIGMGNLLVTLLKP